MIPSQPVPKTYPFPTLVVGIGRLGLSVLEQLGEDWAGLKASGADPTLDNLRLVHVRPHCKADDSVWERHDASATKLARFVEEGDLPSLAVDLILLRTLGLVRFRDGCYQVAVPVDQGVVDVRVGEGHHLTSRLRFFDWRSLSPDPVVSAEMLRRLTDQASDVDLFVTPILNRIKGGYGPSILLACISRCHALFDGRDPSPWVWIRPAEHKNPGQLCRECFGRMARAWAGDSGKSGQATDTPTCEHNQDRICARNWIPTWETLRPEPQQLALRQRVLLDWLDSTEVPQATPSRPQGYLEKFAGAPLPSWEFFLAGTLPAAPEATGMEISVPNRFLPQQKDLASPLDPTHLLRVDWESNGWATEGFDSRDSKGFRPVPASPFRLGLFDHDATVDASESARHQDRLAELGRMVQRGLVRLWIDLQRNRTEERIPAFDAERHRASADASLRQSLEILGELLVRPVLAGQEQDTTWHGRPSSSSRQVDGDALPDTASPFLAGLELLGQSRPGNAQRLLEERIGALGIGSTRWVQEKDPKLLHTVELAENDVDDACSGATTPASAADREGLTRFRTVLNQQTRQLFHYTYLSQYRKRPTRQPPRMTVFLIGDVGEPFVRASMRSLMREAHAELIRAYGPIFETYRTGFDRSLDIVPILWMPHPSDAFGGEYRTENRCEEAAIIDTVHGIRRWVESAPAGKRCISQIFVNGRVTDNAVLSLGQAVRHTRDFLSFLTRNDIAQDEWLRRTAVGPHGDDFFSSFNCLEIDFPVEKAREYLANRLARDSLERLRGGEIGPLPKLDEQQFAPRSVDEMTRTAIPPLRHETGTMAARLAGTVSGRIDPAAAAARQIEDAFSPDFVRTLEADIQRNWQVMVQAQGQMDSMVDDLRRETSILLSEALGDVRKEADELVQHLAARHGLRTMQAGFEKLRQFTRKVLVDRERDRLRYEKQCVLHGIPDTSSIESGRKGVVAKAQVKPDRLPMHVGLGVWTALALVFGAPLPWAISLYFGLPLEPGIFEFILGPLGPLVGGALFAVPAWLVLRWFWRRRVRELAESIAAMAENTRRVVDGAGLPPRDERPCIRSFFEARLEFTAALAGRGFALGVQDQVAQDVGRSQRIHRSVDVQRHLLERGAQDLGARPGRPEGTGRASEKDDVSRLFSNRDGTRTHTLVRAERLHDYYQVQFGHDDHVRNVVPHLIERAGGFAKWRSSATLADSERILAFCRERFASLVTSPLPDQAAFIDDVGEGLLGFVARNYANVGFGAKFVGYEGLDPDGVNKMADATLVISPSLARLYQKAREAPDALPTTETLQIESPEIRQNVAYILSLAQGIRAHSVRNLQRFESFHERIHLPDDRTFPLSGESARQQGPINSLSRYAAKEDGQTR